jgi:hypothetical protein
MKNLKPYLALILLIIVLFFSIREKHNIEKIINNILYQEEIQQSKTIHQYRTKRNSRD